MFSYRLLVFRSCNVSCSSRAGFEAKQGLAPHMSGGATAPAVPVATAEELQAALRGGAAHIVLTQHVDLSQIEPDTAAATFSTVSADGSAASLTAATLSIRVRTAASKQRADH